MHIKKIGQGKDLVLIHGWGMHSGIWEPIIEKFSNQYTLHLVDIPGMGRSDSIDPYDLNHLVEAISQKLPHCIKNEFVTSTKNSSYGFGGGDALFY